MKKTLLAVCLLVIIATACNKPKESNVAYTIGVKDSLYSTVLKEERRIIVFVPKGDERSTVYPRRFPVIYLLDGDAHFLSVTSMIEYLSENQVCPQAIIVAIPNTDRSRDLTPTHSLLLPDGGGPQEFLKTTGGGEKFTEFLEKELIPFVETHYPTAPNKTLIGHSFGGLFAINTLIHHPQLFDSYVAIDPSMWWDNRRLLNQADTILKKTDFSKKTLFLSVANTMTEDMDTARVKTDTAANSSHIRSILQLAKQIITNPANGLRSDWKYYDHDDHGSVPLISEYDALHFIFDYYKPKGNGDQQTVAYLTQHYKTVSDHLGYSILPPEPMINEMAYYAMQQKKWDRAFEFLSFNLKNYSKSQNVWDSMGDYYVHKGDIAKAAEMFKKSLAIEETVATRKKLDELNKKK